MSRRSTQRKPLQLLATNKDEKLKELSRTSLKADNTQIRPEKKMPSPSNRRASETQHKKTTQGVRDSREGDTTKTKLKVKQEVDADKKQQVGVKSAEPVQVSAAAPRSKKRPASPIKANPAKKVMKSEPADSDTHLSDSDSEEVLDYETRRQQNLRDNEAFFSSLGIDMAKEQLRQSTRKPLKPTLKREPKPKVVLPVRKSLRIQRIDPAGMPLPPEPEPQPVVNEHSRLPAGPVNMLDVLENSESSVHTKLCTSAVSIKKDSCCYEPLSSDLARFVAGMQKMHITTKAKACKERLFSVAVHPTADKVLAMAGDKWGRLGFWDIDATDQDTSVVTYRPHSRPVCHIMVHPENPLNIFTCSYDATLRCGDIEKGVFQEVYSVPEEEDDLFRGFDFLSASSLLLGQFRGFVSLLDTRSPGQKAEKKLPVCDRLRTVSVHPTNNNFFCTASSDATVSVWDLRRMSSSKGNKPLHTMMHARTVSSAYFSPLTGSHILSCSADDTLGLFTCSSSCGEVKYTKKISHNNQTGRWLTPFRPVWHPAREDVFFAGSMKMPRRIEAFGVDGRLLHNFDGEVLSSICSVVQFHPSRNILVGGNSSGYIFPFV